MPQSPFNPDKKGVVVADPSMISDTIKRLADRELGKIPPGKKMFAELTIDLDTGINVAYAAKINEQWTVVSWVGSNWSGDVAGGARVTWTK